VNNAAVCLVNIFHIRSEFVTNSVQELSTAVAVKPPSSGRTTPKIQISVEGDYGTNGQAR
jgi:hypothetical protein